MKKFDYTQFSKELNRFRLESRYEHKKKFTFRGIAEDLGSNAPTICRAFNAKPVEVNIILSLCDWMNKPIEQFVKSETCI